MHVRILAIPVILTLVIACGPKPKKKHPAAPPPPPEQNQPPPKKKGGPFIRVTFGNSRPSDEVCSTRDDKSAAPDRVIQRQTINLKMEKQRIVRRDCKGDLRSNQMEKVTFPKTEIIIKPTKWWAGAFGGTPVQAYNRTTCTTPGAEWDKLLYALLFGEGIPTAYYDKFMNNVGFPRLRFSVDTSPTNASMHVRKNTDNYIDYEFSYCKKHDKDSEGRETNHCLEFQTVEKGTLILTVNYTENLDIGGVKEYQDPPCEKEPEQKKP